MFGLPQENVRVVSKFLVRLRQQVCGRGPIGPLAVAAARQLRKGPVKVVVEAAK